MSIIIVITLWIFLAVLGGYAFYRQVRAHLELRRSLHALKNANDLLVNRLELAIKTLEDRPIEQGDPIEKSSGSQLVLSAAEKSLLAVMITGVTRKRTWGSRLLFTNENYFLVTTTTLTPWGQLTFSDAGHLLKILPKRDCHVAWWEDTATWQQKERSAAWAH